MDDHTNLREPFALFDCIKQELTYSTGIIAEFICMVNRFLSNFYLFFDIFVHTPFKSAGHLDILYNSFIQKHYYLLPKKYSFCRENIFFFYLKSLYNPKVACSG